MSCCRQPFGLPSNTPSSSTPCNVTGDDLAFVRYDGSNYLSQYNDKGVVTGASFNPWGIEPSEINFLYGKNTNYYSVTERLVSSNNKAGGTGPSLICPNDNNGGKLSKFTSNDTEYGNGKLPKKVGLLTTDEVVFAGGAFLLQNSTYYLNKNANTGCF